MTNNSENEIVGRLQKSFWKIQEEIENWNENLLLGQSHVNAICVTTIALKSACSASIEQTKLFKHHPDIKSKLVCKLQTDIDEEYKQLNIIMDYLFATQQSILKECAEVFENFRNNGTHISLKELMKRTETRPSIAELLEKLDDIEQQIRNEYIVRKFVVEHCCEEDAFEAQKLKEVWENTQNFTSQMNDIFCTVHPFLQSSGGNEIHGPR